MKRMLSLGFLCLLGFAIVSLPVVSLAQCVTGTVTAELQLAGPFMGLYKYTAEITWDTPQGLSNVTLDCGFDCDPELACAQTYLFEDPAGHSDGEDCENVDYSGEFNCSGNPSIGLNKPIIKWDAIDDGCVPASMGSATLCFYTNVGPHPDADLPVILIKNGLNVCEGTITGDCPALCTVPTEESSWGFIKGRYSN